MKKRVIVLLMAALLCFGGCKNGGDSSSAPDSSSSVVPDSGDSSSAPDGPSSVVPDSGDSGSEPDGSSNEVAFDGYTEEQMIELFDAEKKGGEVANKKEFLEKLQGLRFIKLNDKENYEMGDLKYTITIGADKLYVYADFVVLNNDLYRVSQGNFEFLKEVKVLVKLPWV